MTRRRWIADAWTANSAELHGEQAAHLARVLRAKPGMEFDVVAGGHLFLARVAAVSHERVTFDLLEEQQTESALPLTVLLAVSKFDRMEWALEKVTELGVARIVPVLAARSEKHLVQAAAKRHERWLRIVREAAQQSRRADVPVVDAPTALADALALPTALDRKILLSESERDTPLLKALGGDAGQMHWLGVGTEGGWTAAEMQAFSGSGFLPVTLGPRILRVETAVIAAVSAISAAWLARDG